MKIYRFSKLPPEKQQEFAKLAEDQEHFNDFHFVVINEDGELVAGCKFEMVCKFFAPVQETPKPIQTIKAIQLIENTERARGADFLRGCVYSDSPFNRVLSKMGYEDTDNFNHLEKAL